MVNVAKPASLTVELSEGESGFSLVEITIALMILMIVVMGVFAAFTYSTVNNTGNSWRSQALSVLQEEVEVLRSLKFNPPPAVVAPELAGGVKAPRTRPAADGVTYLVNVTVDDDPFTDGVQIDPTQTIKEITLTVTPPASDNMGAWVTANQTQVIFRRVRSN